MERAFVVHVALSARPYRDTWSAEDSFRELLELVQSSGVEVADKVLVRRDRPTPHTFIGKGKLQELHGRCGEIKANVVIFGEDLSFQQQRNLEDILGVKVVDRTQLILDIFAQRARSQEGKVQVELAQLQYLLPRLAGQGVLLSRLGGGIGTRGPGEQKLEVDRRRVRTRIRRLENTLQEIHSRRGIARQKRHKAEIPTAALVGYTNAGKTTLLNAMTDAGAKAENQLFTTLDPLNRRVVLPNHQPILLSDTVGFLHRLPHHLIESFQATLEEVALSDLLIHVVDASSDQQEEQLQAVEEVLRQFDAHEKPAILVFNKIDLLTPQLLGSLRRRQPEAVFLSALTKQGLNDLVARLSLVLGKTMQMASIRLPFGAEHWLARIYSQGRVLSRKQVNDRIELTAQLPDRLYGQLSKAGFLQLPIDN